MVTLHCDAPECRATVVSWSKEDYEHQLDLGWRVIQVMPRLRTVACPAHSEAEPAVDVQQELAL